MSVGWIIAIDVCLAVIVGAATLVVHDVPYMLHHSYWLDEAWVADSARARIGLTPSLGLSTPLGWTLLLRIVPFGGPDKLRLVPLAFTILAGAAGYWLGRELQLSRFTTGILTGAAVLLSPAMLVRDDLKQYTAEAFVALLLWVLVARIENGWSRRTLGAIAGVTAFGLFFSDTAIFVGAAAMASLAFECILRRRFRLLVEIAIASTGMLLASLAVYAVFIRPEVTGTLTSFWDDYYIPTHGLSAALHNVHLRFTQLAPFMGFKSLWINGIFAVGGIVGLVWLRRYALAALLPITLIGFMAASALRKYPFGDLRTSTFWLVSVPVLMAIGVACVIRLLARIDRPVALVAAAACLAVWVGTTFSYVRSHTLPPEDVYAEVQYLDSHMRPGDVVIVSFAASFGFAYYEPGINASYVADPVSPNDRLPVYPNVPWLIEMHNRRATDVAGALASARSELTAEGSRATGRIWIVRSHLAATEALAWQADLAGKDVATIHVGPEPLLLYTVGSTPAAGA